MAHAVETRINTPSAELRDLLDKAERQLPTLDSASLGGYLQRLDRIDALFAQIEVDHAERNSDADQALRSELVRWHDLQRQLQRRSRRLVRLAAASGGFAALRSQYASGEGMWWRLDELVAAQRRTQLKRLLQTLTVVIVLGVVGVFAYQTWFAPDPETIALVSSLNAIERHVDAQEWTLALDEAENALSSLGESAELLTWAAVIAERLGDETMAARYREQALTFFGDRRLQFYILLGTDRFRAGDLAGADEAAEAALTLDPDEPQVYFLLGNIAEARGDVNAALDAFDRAATLAEADNPQLAVVSKMRYGFLLQQLQAIPNPAGASTAPEDDASNATPPATP
jgi:tetratricopeptide (TPR) repeat protein